MTNKLQQNRLKIILREHLDEETAKQIFESEETKSDDYVSFVKSCIYGKNPQPKRIKEIIDSLSELLANKTNKKIRLTPSEKTALLKRVLASYKEETEAKQ